MLHLLVILASGTCTDKVSSLLQTIKDLFCPVWKHLSSADTGASKLPGQGLRATQQGHCTMTLKVTSCHESSTSKRCYLSLYPHLFPDRIRIEFTMREIIESSTQYCQESWVLHESRSTPSSWTVVRGFVEIQSGSFSGNLAFVKLLSH